jgi:hypothetical protein
MECRVWSITDAEHFTGLCSMVMLAETASKTKKCEICVTPVDPDEPIETEELHAECRMWTLPLGLFSPLCSMEFFPENGLASCPICITPVEVEE